MYVSTEIYYILLQLKWLNTYFPSLHLNKYDSYVLGLMLQLFLKLILLFFIAYFHSFQTSVSDWDICIAHIYVMLLLNTVL